MIPMQPLEINDFSGGITDNYLLGDPRRYQHADNYLIDEDKKLFVRPPLWTYEAQRTGLLSGYTERITGLYNLLDKSLTVAALGRNLIYLYRPSGNEQWGNISGVASNPALQGGDKYSQVSIAEWQGQLFLTSDGDTGIQQGVNPSSAYRNSSGEWKARTLGLPRSYTYPLYDESGLLGACISLANDLRTKMISHMNDAKYTSYTTPGAFETSATALHLNIDHYSLSYLEAQTFRLIPVETQPSPLPTPAPAATNQATLFTLVGALNNAYTAHVTDAMKNSFGTPVTYSLYPNATNPPIYHQDMPYSDYITNVLFAGGLSFPKTIKGPGAALSNNATPDTLIEAAAMLNDLRSKWEWHRLTVNTHSPTNNYADINKYNVTANAVSDTVTTWTTPQVTPDFGDIFAYVENIKYLFNYHIGDQGELANQVHKVRDWYGQRMYLYCGLPTVTTLDQAYVTTYWLRALYYMHQWDAQLAAVSTVYSAAFTNGSANLTSVATSPAAVAATVTAGQVMELSTGNVVKGVAGQNGQASLYWTARVSSSGSGTITMDRQAASTATYTFQANQSEYHSATNSSLAWVDSTEDRTLAAELLASPVTATGTSKASWISLATELFLCLGAHANNQLVHKAGTLAVGTSWDTGLTLLPNLNFVTPSVASYSYAYFFSNEFEVYGGTTYLVQGNPVFSDALDCAISYPVGYSPTNVNPYYTQKPVATQRENLLTGLPVLANSGATNYDTANVKLNIYRSTDGGNTYYLLDQVDNGTTSYTDVINDTAANDGNLALNERQVIYTSGGVQGYDQPPKCKFIHIFNNTAYFGGVWDSGQFFPNRLVQSVAGSMDGAPATNYYDFESDITGISSTKSSVVVFCKDAIYRLSGGFNLLGQGQILADQIGDKIGCLNSSGIVRTETGIFFPGTVGFYYTDGYQLIKCSLDLDATYQSFSQTEAQTRNIWGAYDDISRRVWWLVKQNPGDSENSKAFILHTNYGIKPSSAFTTASSGDADYFRFASMVFRKGVPLLGHEGGEIMYLNKWNKKEYDPVNNWYTHVPYNYVSCAMDMGSVARRKWVTKMHLIGKNVGNALIQPSALRDLNQYGQNATPMAQVNYRENCWWGNSDLTWGDANFVWKTDGKNDVWRRLPQGQLRSDVMQIKIAPAFGLVYSSEQDYPGLLAGCFVEHTPARATIFSNLDSFTGSLVWPEDIEGMYIKFGYENYEYSYELSEPTGDEVSIFDPDGRLVLTDVTSFEIWGYKKQASMRIDSIDLHYGYLGDKNQAYGGAKYGGPAGNMGGNNGSTP
jgi:hypothetical protein